MWKATFYYRYAVSVSEVKHRLRKLLTKTSGLDTWYFSYPNLNVLEILSIEKLEADCKLQVELTIYTTVHLNWRRHTDRITKTAHPTESKKPKESLVYLNVTSAVLKKCDVYKQHRTFFYFHLVRLHCILSKHNILTHLIFCAVDRMHKKWTNCNWSGVWKLMKFTEE
jgi:hypothetical protein